MAKKQHPTITIEHRGGTGFYTNSANWVDETHRYHVWLTEEGVPHEDPVIYKDLLVRIGGYRDRRNNTLRLSLDAKANTWVRPAIAELVAAGALAKARETFEKAEAEKEAAELAADAAQVRKALRSYARRCGATPGRGTAVEALYHLANALTDREACALAQTIANGRVI